MEISWSLIHWKLLVRKIFLLNFNTSRAYLLKLYFFPIWLQKRLTSAGLEPVISHIDNSCTLYSVLLQKNFHECSNKKLKLIPVFLIRDFGPFGLLLIYSLIRPCLKCVRGIWFILFLFLRESKPRTNKNQDNPPGIDHNTCGRRPHCSPARLSQCSGQTGCIRLEWRPRWS